MFKFSILKKYEWYICVENKCYISYNTITIRNWNSVVFSICFFIIAFKNDFHNLTSVWIFWWH